MSLLQRNSTNVSSIESVIRARFGRMINPLCENTRSTSDDNESILNGTVKIRSLLSALVLALQYEATKASIWQGQGLECQALSVKAKANAMTTNFKAHIAKCSHCSVQCWQLTN